MHEHAFPMRWADLDQLNHVNNVVYLDYAAEARALLTQEGVVGADRDVAAMAVRFLRPMHLTREAVVVRSTSDGDTLSQDITVASRGSSAPFAEVTTQYGGRPAAAPRDDVPSLPVNVRRSDLDELGAVRLTKLFELFQEVRVLMISTHLGSMRSGSFVVGSSSVAFGAPVPWRLEPYVVRVWVSRVGRASFEIRCQLTDDNTVLADSTTVMVGFDQDAESSRPFGEDERAQLQELLRD